MLGRADGEAGFARNLFRCVRRICRGEKGMYLTGYPVKAWEHGRYSDPYLRDALGDFGIVIDTLETSVRWDQVRPVHQAVRSFLKERPGTMALAHSSHFYPQGTNLYFIFIARMDDVAEYRSFQRGVIDRIEAAGGSLSHHHGVGRMMGDRLEGHLGPVAMGALKALKNYFDPRGVMNPGGLGL
jgi:alkyldihydroxyacetonephosphate synthase